MTTLYEVFSIHSLDGGMATSFSPRLLDQSKGYARTFKNMENLLPGLPQKRPAVEEWLETANTPTGLHEFVKLSTEEKFILVSFTDRVRSYHNGAWSDVVTGLETGAPVYFITIADQVAFGNGYENLFVWDGSDLSSDVGGEKATRRTFLLYENNDLSYTARQVGADGNYIRIRYIKHDSAGTSTSATLTGSGTEEDPYFITVNLEWHVDSENQEVIDSTANQVKSAVEANSSINNLVEVEHVSGSDGSTEVLEMPEQHLIGGHEAVKGKFMIEYRLRAVVADGSQIRLSHTGDPHLWSPYKAGSNAVETYVSPDDGEEISGLLNMGDGGVLIGKPNGLYGLFGYKRQNFVIDQLDPNVGVASHRSMAFLRPYGYFVGQDGVYRVEPGGIPARISAPIQELYDELVDKERLEEATGYIKNGLYIVSLPTKDGESTTFCWNTRQENIALWDEPSAMVDVIHTSEGVRFAKKGYNNILQVVPGKLIDYNEHPIEAEYLSVELDVHNPLVEKDINDLYVVFRCEDEPYEVEVAVYVDGQLSVKPVRETVTGVKDRQFVLRVPVGRTARFMEVSIKNNQEGQQFTPMAMYYTFQVKDVL